MTEAAIRAKGRKGRSGTGPNARKRVKSADPRLTVPFSLPPKNSAELAIQFLETLKIPEGRLAGQPLKLAEFQKKFVRGALADGVMVAVLSIGRGNAKTALSAGLALGALKGIWDDQPKREILFAARNRDQAKTAFQFLVGFIEGLPEEEQELFTIRRGAKLEVEYSANGGGLARCVAADGKSILGGAPTLALMDERAAWEPEKGDSLENAILSGLGKRDGRALIISTSAPDDTNTFSRWMDEPPIGTYVQEHRPAFGLPADDLPSLMEANPGAVEGFRALKTPEDRKKEHLPWPNWAVDRFRNEADDLPRLIFEIGVGSVQRPSDWLRFTWGDYDGDTLKLRQGKTDKPLILPCTANLKAALEQAQRALGATPIAARPILTQPNGNPMSYFYMAKVMRKERVRLGLEAYDMHALRYRSIKELAWAGCDDDEIAAYSGHATKAMIAKYAGEARQEMRARQAREKRK